MAQEDITTRFKVDVSDLKKGITEARKQIESANAKFKAASAGMDDWAKSSKGLNEKIKQLTTVLAQEKIKLENYNQQLKKQQEAYKENGLRADKLRAQLKALAEQGVAKTDDEYKKLQKSLSKVEQEQISNKNAAESLQTTILNQQGTVNKLNKDLGNYKTTLTQVEKAEKTAARTGKSVDEVLKDMEGSTRNASEGFTVMKGALANLVADGIRTAVNSMKDFVKQTITVGREFDSAMSKVGAISGATGEELEKLREKAKEMGSTTKFTATEAAEALNYMAMAGWDTEDMLGGLEGVLNLAAASGSDLATTSDIVTDALTAMGYEAKDAGKLADVMAAASSNANTNVEMMGQTFQYAGPIIGAMGYEMEDAAVAIGLMANAGIKGEKAGTALRSVLTRLSAPPAECAKAMDKLGISISNADGTMKPLDEVIQQLRKSFSGLSEAEQTQMAKSLAGQEAMSGLLAIVNAAPSDFEKLTQAVDKSSGAAEKMASTMQDNLGGDLTKLQSQFEGVQIQIYEKLEPALRKGAAALSKLLDGTDWNKFGENAANALEKVIKGFQWVINHKSSVVGTIKAVVAAFAVAKIAKFTTELSKMGKGLVSVATTGKALTAITKGMTVAQIANTTATNAGTVATNLFNAAWKANPIGMVITGVALLAGGIYALVKATKASTSETDANIKATEKLIEDHNELTKSINENAEARKKSISEAGNEAATAEILFGKLEKLQKVEGKSNEQKQQMKSLVSELNALIPDLNLKYDENTDKLNKSTDAIRSQIQATKELAMAKAAESQLTEIASEMVELEKERANLIEQQTINQNEYDAAVKNRADFESKYSQFTISNNDHLQRQYIGLLQAEKDKKKALDDTQGAIDGNTTSMNNLNKEYDQTTQLSSKLFDKAEITTKLSDLTELCKKAGVQIPTALKEGMEAGKYVVPDSVEGLNKLINFDNALKTAGLAGVDIPRSISDGVVSGKTSVEDAIGQVNEVVNFNEALKKAQEDGIYIPENLAQNMLDGTITVKQANDELNAAIEFDAALKKAQEDGTKIPNDLAEQVRNGKMTVSEANNIINAAIKFDESVKNAGEQGTAISNNLADKMKEGQVSVDDANKFINETINFTKALEESGQKGSEIPTLLSQKIANGQITVSQAVEQMNNWIQFTDALSETENSGYEIPQILKNNILNGKTSVDDAITQMNNWVKFQGALNAADLAGIAIPKEIADGILSGKTEAKDAIALLNKDVSNESNKLPTVLKTSGAKSGQFFDDGIYNGLNDSGRKSKIKTSISGLGRGMLSTLNSSIDAHSPSRATYQSGGWFLDGVYNGISRRDKRNSIFSAISSFGSSLLSRLRRALQEHSPSKATEEMGINLLLGLSNGIKNQVKPVMKQVSNFGKSVVNTLSSQLSGESNLLQIGTNLKNSLSEAKSGISSMVSPNNVLSTVGAAANSSTGATSTVNNFTQNIYAPEQPSRIELYRDTRNLLNFVKREG